jgi:hypothetical protein
MNFLETTKVLTLALALCAVSTASPAQNCRMYPPGPERFACASQNHPGLLIKQERCKEEGQAMGLLPGAGGRKALQDFVMACMHRKG